MWCVLQCFDECAELSTKALDALRTPLEEGEVRIARRDGVARYPARFQLVLAANPCPCAPPRETDCVCGPAARRRYLGKLSGPLVDRVDVRVKLAAPTGALRASGGETSAAVRERVTAARLAAAARWEQFGYSTNGEVPGPVVRRSFTLPYSVVAPLEDMFRRGQLTSRGADRAMRVAWTISDLRGRSQPVAEDVEIALGFRDGVRG